QADISVKGVPKTIVEECVKEFGQLDILVNCAGICIIKDVLEFDREDWDPMIAINLTAAFELSHEAAKYMIPQKSGKIINICSLFSFLGGLGSPAYAAMKHGLTGFTKAYADELGKYGIQVNGIAPGYFATKLTTESTTDTEKNKRILDHIPAERWGERQDLMGACVFLASQASAYVNGTMLVVDGGYLVR
ncbi:MAG: SDR family oxidoreductase, partial [Hungatella sp.]